ncbi:hypothetical protein BC832DRAFT_590747 [Gaertneriomyces semiglobifer]|nr:hypothetical protein BC832DRAFT_590747 [Gaertneriomyces semiglobifer]
MSSVITLAGDFPADAAKHAATLDLHQRLADPQVSYSQHARPSISTSASTGKPVVTRHEILALLNDLPFPARVQFVLKAIAPSAICDEVIASLYSAAMKVYTRDGGSEIRQETTAAASDDLAGVADRTDLEEEGDDLDWEFLTSLDLCTITPQSATAQGFPSRTIDNGKRFSSEDNYQSISATMETNATVTPDQSLKLMVGEHFHLLELLVATAPHLGDASRRIFEDYVRSNGQRFRLRFLDAMIASPLISDEFFLDAMAPMPRTTVARCLKAWANHRLLRIGLFDQLIQQAFVQIVINSKSFQVDTKDVQDEITLGSDNMLLNSGVLAYPGFRFMRWNLHAKLYTQWIEDRFAKCGDDVLARGDFMQSLFITISPSHEAYAFIVRCALKFPSFSFSSHVGNDIKDALRAMIETGKLLKPDMCPHLQPVALPEHLLKGISSSSWRAIMGSHVKETQDKGLIITSDALLNLLHQIVVNRIGSKFAKRMALWVAPLAIRYFEQLPSEVLIQSSFFCSSKFRGSDHASKTAELFTSYYKSAIKQIHSHLLVGRMALAWTNMHNRVTDAHLPTTDTDARQAFWEKWHASCTVALHDVLDQKIPELRGRSLNASFTRKQPDSLVSLYGLVDLVFSLIQQAWEKWKEESLKLGPSADNGHWWKGSKAEQLYAWLSKMVSSVQACADARGPFDEVRASRRLHDETVSFSPQLFAALRAEIAATRLDTINENKLWIQRFADTLWAFGIQNVFPAKLTGDDADQWLARYTDICFMGLEKGTEIAQVDGGRKRLVWIENSYRFEKLDSKAQQSVSKLFKTYLERILDCSVYFAGYETENVLFRCFDALCGMLKKPSKKGLPENIFSGVESQYFALLHRLPVKLQKRELDNITLLIGNVLVHDVLKAQSLFELVERNNKEVSEAVMAGLLSNNVFRESIMKTPTWWATAPISLQGLRDEHANRKSAEPDERILFYLAMLQASMKAGARDLGCTLESLRKRTRNERGMVTRVIYQWLSDNTCRWLPMILNLSQPDRALEVSEATVKTLSQMIEADLQRRDSVARLSLLTWPRAIISLLMRARMNSEAYVPVFRVWIDFAINTDWVFVAANSGDEGLEKYNWCDGFRVSGPAWASQLVQYTAPDLQGVQTTYAHFLERVPKKRELYTTWLVQHSRKMETVATGTRLTPVQCVKMLNESLDNAQRAEYERRAHSQEDRSWLLKPAYDVAEGLESEVELNRISCLFDVVGSGWQEVPELIHVLNVITESVRLCTMRKAAADITKITLTRKLFQFLTRRQALWFCIPELQVLGEALFMDAVERCRSDDEEASTTTLPVSDSTALEQWLEIQLRKPLADVIQCECFFQDPVHRSFFLEALRENNFRTADRLQCDLQIPPPNRSNIASMLYRICPTSAIHVDLVRRVLMTERTDLLTPYVKDPKSSFSGPLKRIQGKGSRVLLEPREFRSAVGFMNGQQATLVGLDILRTAMSLSNSLAVTQHNMEQYAGWPTVDYKAYIDLIFKMRDADQPSHLLETIILRSFDHDSCLVILSQLLSVENLPKLPQRVLVSILERLPAIVRPSQFVDLLALLLAKSARRDAIGVVFHKAIVRMLLSSVESVTAAELLEAEWNEANLHIDVRTELFAHCLKVICSHEGTVALDVNPVAKSAWKIFDSACAQPGGLALESLGSVCGLTYRSDDRNIMERIRMLGNARYALPEWAKLDPNEESADAAQFLKVESLWRQHVGLTYKEEFTRARMVQNLSTLAKGLRTSTDPLRRGLGFMCFVKTLSLSHHLMGDRDLVKAEDDEDYVISALDTELTNRFAQRLDDTVVAEMKTTLYRHQDQSLAHLLGLACAASICRRAASDKIINYVKECEDSAVVILRKQFERCLGEVLQRPLLASGEGDNETDDALVIRLVARQAAYATIGVLTEGFRSGVAMYLEPANRNANANIVKQYVDCVLTSPFAKRLAVLRLETFGLATVGLETVGMSSLCALF